MTYTNNYSLLLICRKPIIKNDFLAFLFQNPKTHYNKALIVNPNDHCEKSN